MKIRSNDELTAALSRIDALWGNEPGTPDGDELDALTQLVELYESEHFPFPAEHRGITAATKLL